MKTRHLICTLCALALVVGAAGPALFAADEERVVRKRVVRHCDGEDCGDRTMVFVDEDGEATELLGDDHVWIGKGDHGKAFHFRHGGELKGGFLGVQLSDLTAELRTHFGVPEDAGVLVAKVVDDSAAARADIRVGDIITAVDGEAVRGAAELARAIRRSEEGETVTLELWRDGQVETVAAVLDERRGMGALHGHESGHAMVLHCDDDGGDCESLAVGGLGDLDCGDEGRCEVKVECYDGGCDCTVNGEAADCETIPGFVAPGE